MVRRRDAAFSLVELLVVIAIITVLGTLVYRGASSALESGRVTTCKSQLKDIGQTMMVYRDHRNGGRWPDASGIRFLLTLHRSGEVVGKDTSIFLCPGTNDRNDNGLSGAPGSSYEDWDAIDSADISYAGRDTDAYPLRGTRYEEMIIASDDNEFGPNHRNATNYLYADGAVATFDMGIDGLDLLEEHPELERTGLPIGPDCPFEPLRVLRVD